MKKRILATVVALAVLATTVIGSVISVSAAEHSTDGSAACTVSATVKSTYTVSLPATLNLVEGSGNAFSGTYTVGAKGNIDDTHYVEITPVSSFTMTGATTNKTETATVTQNATKWKRLAGSGYEVIGTDDFAQTTGSVVVTLTQADAYSGDVEFTFGLKSIS